MKNRYAHVPLGSKSFQKLNGALYANTENKGEVQNAKPERNETPTLGGSVQGKEDSIPRVTVRFTGHRVKPLDPDNFAGSVKDLLDGLRHAKIIHGDEWWRITLETRQVKVAHYADEFTEIEIQTIKKALSWECEAQLHQPQK